MSKIDWPSTGPQKFNTDRKDLYSVRAFMLVQSEIGNKENTVVPQSDNRIDSEIEEMELEIANCSVRLIRAKSLVEEQRKEWELAKFGGGG